MCIRDRYDRDGQAIQTLMNDFASGAMTLSEDALGRARELFDSHALSDKETVAIIKSVYDSSAYLLDPHTAIGLAAARTHRRNNETPMVCLATAHPAKFPEAVNHAVASLEIPLPAHMTDLFERPEDYQVLADDIEKVQSYIADRFKT